MGKALTEAQVLKKLDIPDFRHLTKEKVVSMATMLDKMDPEVAKKALEQFPEFASTMRHIFSDFKQALDEALKQNADSVMSCYETYDAIISSCQKILEKEDLSSEERKFILEQMIIVAKMKDDTDTKNKRFITAIVALGTVAFGIAVTALITTLGGNAKFDTDTIKKLA